MITRTTGCTLCKDPNPCNLFGLRGLYILAVSLLIDANMEETNSVTCCSDVKGVSS